ncbi:MAG: hypothetical protein FJ265_10780, partial [Planctomycetes bacterium]|nr:hypothetical protein [Planctomycetota bacterium]
MLVRAASSGLGCLLLAVAALPQDGPAVRRATFVRVVDRDGGPVAGAVVTLAGGLPHLGGELAPADTQQVAADARGRASAKLLPGLCYVAWAVGPAAAGQQCWMSPVAGWFGAGAVVELRCHTPVAPRALQCRGAEAWQSSGPLQFVALTPYPGAEVDLVPEPDGTLLLPPGPFTVIEVRTREGAPLF